MKLFFVALACAAALPTAAFAAKPSNTPVLGATGCAAANIAPAMTGCTGFYEGNLNAGSPAATAMSEAALKTLLGTGYTAATLSFAETLGSISGNRIDFATPLYGDTVIAVHVGAANGQATGVGYQGTAFYRFDAGAVAGGLDSIGFNVAGLSNARLYYTSSAVPEPGSWAMMMAGLGMIGGFARRRAKRVVFA